MWRCLKVCVCDLPLGPAPVRGSAGSRGKAEWLSRPLSPTGVQEVFPVMQKGPGLYMHPNSVVGCSWRLELLGTVLCSWGRLLPRARSQRQHGSLEVDLGGTALGLWGHVPAGFIGSCGLLITPCRASLEFLQERLQIRECCSWNRPCSLLVRPSPPLFSDEDSPVRRGDGTCLNQTPELGLEASGTEDLHFKF